MIFHTDLWLLRCKTYGDKVAICVFLQFVWFQFHKWSDRTYFFLIKLTFDMLTVRGQQHSFSTHERMFLWKCQDFETENVSTWGGLEPPTFGFMPNALTIWAIRARHLLSHVVEYWLWRYRYFLRKANIWYVNCARATAFISTHERMFLWKCQSFWD